MNRAAPLRSLALTIAGLVLLTGCWTGSDEPAATGPVPVCPAGSTSQSTYECRGVTVAGEQDAEPTITLAQDFGPATELAVADVYEGSGDAVAPNATVTVNYVGVGQQSGQVFDSSWQRGQPATFGLDGVIQGWSEGLVGMKPGGRRLLIIPAELGYGEAGAGTDIAPGETLVFVVDLIEATPPAS